MANERYLTTGQLAKYSGMTVRTLRYYDQTRFVVPAWRPLRGPANREESSRSWQEMIGLSTKATSWG